MPSWNKHKMKYEAIKTKYCQTSDISHTKSQNLNVSHLVLQLSLPNSLKPVFKSRIKIQLEQRRQAMLQLHRVVNNCIAD